MRTLILAIFACACQGRDNPGADAVKTALVTPRVDLATVLAKDTDKPPVLLVVGDAGVRVGAAASWADLDAGEWKITRGSGSLEQINRHVREDYLAGIQPSSTVARLDEQSDDETSAVTQDDPPPPEEEDTPDHGGGPGTSITLEEGKMGKKDFDRAEGQYKMKKEDPDLARRMAIERAKPTARLGMPAKGGVPVRSNPDGVPSRVAEVQGVVIEDGKLEPMRAMIFIAPKAKATKLIEVVRETEGSIAVSLGGQIRPLRLQFMTRGYFREPHHWIEARVSMNGLAIEAVPDAPIEVRDLKQLADAIDNARRNRGAEATAPVDVLVDAETSVQRMIDVIVALDLAGVRLIGLGSTPVADELARRGRRMPTVSMGQPNAQGDLDKAIIRRFIIAEKQKFLECYTNALSTKPDLRGTVQTQFFINPHGIVASSSGSGVDPIVATCVAAVIKRVEFPKPKGGGGVQVNYPFTFRP